MTKKEMRDRLLEYCDKNENCRECPLYEYNSSGRCWIATDSNIERNYALVFGCEDENPYWERICKLSDRQRAKGLATYGQGLEKNPADILKRIDHLEEELIDGLMYCEWLKDAVETIMGKDGKNE